MKRLKSAFIFSSPTLPNDGIFEYRIVSPPFARLWYKQNAPVCNIGNQLIADAFGLVLGETLEGRWRRVEMEKGDEALVFRLRLKADSPLLRRPRVDIILAHSEIGYLRKIAL